MGELEEPIDHDRTEQNKLFRIKPVSKRDGDLESAHPQSIRAIIHVLLFAISTMLLAKGKNDTDLCTLSGSDLLSCSI